MRSTNGTISVQGAWQAATGHLPVAVAPQH